jgi:hypothetical protein
LRLRQLVTVAALAAMGGAEPQLRFHIAGFAPHVYIVIRGDRLDTSMSN